MLDNIRSVDIILSRGFESQFNQAVNLATTTVLATILLSLEHSLAAEPKQSTLNTNPHSLIPAPLSQLTTFTIKTFETKFPSRCCRVIHGQENPASLREGAEVINRLLAISLESSWIERVPGIGRGEIDRGWEVSCYQLIWAAGVGRNC
ncbi:hypothetical protein BPAE_0063g00240 [Botrytis paeoniae]|uniref:Uncharacterized protein n=1 Tax=Botrytis paeoniae TaxID=278948 RepID=A0A4Z1FP45_9HELO|nr:hypothetical protein BPAE_0063g00240 [Botrytis paeoniae]